MEEQYGPQINHASFFADVDDGYMYFGETFYVPIDEDKLTKELPDEWRELSKLSDQFRKKLDVNASVYAEEVEIEIVTDLKLQLKWQLMVLSQILKVTNHFLKNWPSRQKI